MSDTELLLKPKPEPEPVRRLEVFTGAGRRRRWSSEQKARIVSETYETGETVSAVARRHGLTPQQLFGWRRNGRPRVGKAACENRAVFAPVVMDARPGGRRRKPSPDSSPTMAVGECRLRKGMIAWLDCSFRPASSNQTLGGLLVKRQG